MSARAAGRLPLAAITTRAIKDDDGTMTRGMASSLAAMRMHPWADDRPSSEQWQVIAFDLPSHNESEPGELAPGRTTATECASAIAAMIETHGPAHAVVAHSLGANATALAAAQGVPVGRLVLLSPMGDFPLYLDLFAARHGFGRRIRAGLHRRLERRIDMPLQETNMSRVGRRANYPPLLLIHDPDDPDSPYAANERLVVS